VQGDAAAIGGGIVFDGEAGQGIEGSGAPARLVENLSCSDDAHVVCRALECAQVVGQCRGWTESLPGRYRRYGGADGGGFQQRSAMQRLASRYFGDDFGCFRWVRTIIVGLVLTAARHNSLLW